MKNTNWLKESLLTGNYASITSALALAFRSKAENGSYFSAINAISHWLWKAEAYQHDEPDIAHTLIGYGIHHASSTFWALAYEKLRERHQGKTDPKFLADAFKVAALACFVDYKLTPQRLQPGYEKRLSTLSLVGVYTAFAFGLAGRQLIKTKK
ncbi:MAG: hypothetical protein Q8J65_05680 [Nitrosomonadales bacterium]|nr:hypothetical protein [Nitrosomonadales bacterium]